MNQIWNRSEATPDCHFKLLQWYFKKCMWSFCGPHSTNVGVNSAREYYICFICLKHSVKPVVLLFLLIEYQIRKLLVRVEVRRFQFFVMLQLVGIPQYRFRVIRSARHFCTTFMASSKLLEHCSPHVQKLTTWIAPSAPLWWKQQRLLKGVHFLDVKNL